MTINNKGVLPAIGLGMMAGAALTMIAAPKPSVTNKAKKAARDVGHFVDEVVDDISEAVKR